jgi:hypothetical protein
MSGEVMLQCLCASVCMCHDTVMMRVPSACA